MQRRKKDDQKNVNQRKKGQKVRGDRMKRKKKQEAKRRRDSTFCSPFRHSNDFDPPKGGPRLDLTKWTSKLAREKL
jgi:hypothetical protein